MAWCPFAVHKPLSENYTQGSIVPRAIIAHTAVSKARSLFNFFQNNSILESHFYIQEDGGLEQYMDTLVRADANKNANDFAISIESWDNGEIRAWSSAQIETLVWLIDWLCTTHNIPREQIPVWNGAGIGWHVMFGAPGPWTPVAKSCPGGPRIEQMKNLVIPRVARREIGEIDMATPSENWGHHILFPPGTVPGDNPGGAAWMHLANSNWQSLQAWQAAEACKVQLAKLAGTLEQTEADILAAIRALPTGADVDETALAVALGPILLPVLQAGFAEEVVVDAVRSVFRDASSDEEN